MTRKPPTAAPWLIILFALMPLITVKGQSDLFILNLVTNQKPYKGEVIVLTQKLYTRLAINNIGRVKHPSFNGFWTEDLDIGNYEIIQEQYEGKLYNTLVLSRTVLIPQRSGTIVIDPSSVMIQRVTERTVSRPLFGGVIQQRVRDISDHEIKSSSLTLEVRALPESDKPASFQGSVGKLSFEAQLTPSIIEVGEPAELTVTVSGTGNLKLMDKPRLQLPAGLELFDPEVSGKVTVNAAGMSGSRTFKYLVIPRDTGRFSLQEIEFSYFNPETGRYQTTTSLPLLLTASPPQGQPGYRTANMTKEDVRYLSKDIRFIRRDFRLPRMIVFTPGSWIHLVLLLFPLVLFILWIIRYRKKVKMVADQDKLRFSKAYQTARENLKKAGAAMKQQNDTTFYQHMLNALWGFAADKLNLKPADLTRGKIAASFASKGFNQDLIQRYLALIDECEFSKYSPVNQPFQMEKIHQEAMSVIDVMM